MPNADITTILTSAEIAALRKGYSDAFMRAGARDALISRLPRCAPVVNADLELFYHANYGSKAGEIGENGREHVVLTALGSSGNWDMARIHIYWALCLPKTPLSPAQIGEVFVLAGSYAGIQVTSMGLSTTGSVFEILKGAVAAGVTTSDKIVRLLLGESLAEVQAVPASPKASVPPAEGSKAAKPEKSAKAGKRKQAKSKA